MKKQITLLVLGLWFNITYAQQKDDKQLVSNFDKVLSEQFKTNEPGAAVLVARKGEIIYKKAFGMANLELNVPMQTNNVFRIASITKQFTAIAILQLMEQGKLNLQDEITKFIPDYPTHGYKITIEHLLTHTSGIANNTDLPDNMDRMDLKPTEMIDHFKNQPMKFAPGTNWSYSNNGYFLLGYIVEKISGKTYAEYLDEHFFKPLGMNNSLYANDIKLVSMRTGAYALGANGFENAQPLSMTHPYSAGAIQSTIEDLFKWHQAVHSYKLVKKETLDKALTRYKLTDEKETDYGYGWRMGFVYDSPTFWHGGLIQGFMTMELYLPKEDVFVTIFSNCECNNTQVITSKLAALAIGIPDDYKEITLKNNILKDYTGVYENKKGLQRIITLSGNALFSQLGRSPKSEIKAFQKDKFFFSYDAMQTLEFSKNKKGTMKLTIKKLAGNEVWDKTDKPLPDQNGIKVNGKILESYVGEYEVTPDFKFTISKEQDKLYLQAGGQEKLELFADTENKFFLKVNDAQFEFVQDNTGKVTKAILNQGGKQADAKKVK